MILIHRRLFTSLQSILCCLLLYGSCLLVSLRRRHNLLTVHRLTHWNIFNNSAYVSSEALKSSLDSWHTGKKTWHALFSLRENPRGNIIYRRSVLIGGLQWAGEEICVWNVKTGDTNSNNISWVLPDVLFLLTIMDGNKVCTCMCVSVREQKNMNVSLSLHPSRLPVDKDNLTPANAMRHLVFECRQV